ncbi:hypothetical protein WN944_001044 [Citrus x changshan-huyou]|uniref:Uncharacterized protein n=1 Tax=Citrus x changshan-huyou TaxID=2935761 RepID=A0AAP0MGH1_9ROSI
MEMCRLMRFIGMAIAALLFFTPFTSAQSPSPAPAPTSDGVAIDQGIACVLMLVALVLTYIIH